MPMGLRSEKIFVEGLNIRVQMKCMYGQRIWIVGQLLYAPIGLGGGIIAFQKVLPRVNVSKE